MSNHHYSREPKAVSIFREYLRIPSVHPEIDYSKCVSFLKRLANEIGLNVTIAGTSNKPVVLLKWEGTDQNAGSILLNSHMDVVPVKKELWKFDPFEAVKDEQGDIYGRGSQDCKCLGIMYLEAVRNLIEEGFKPKRNVYISFVPDEEIGGKEGMGAFVRSNEFKQLNVAFAFDEGGPSPGDKFLVFNDERCSFPLKFICNGTTGHGSLLHPNTAGEKIRKIIDVIMDFRQSQVMELTHFPNSLSKLAEVTAINLTKLEGGLQRNVVPPSFSATFDIRLSVNTDHDKFKHWIEEICSEVGDNVTFEILENNPKIPCTKTDESNPFWIALKQTIEEMNLDVEIIGCPGATDSRYLRMLGILALGFTPMRNTPVLCHSENERLNENVFLDGIQIYKNVISAVSNV